MSKKLVLTRLAQLTIGSLIILEFVALQANFTTKQIAFLALSLLFAVVPLGLLPEISLILKIVAKRFEAAKLTPKKLSALDALTAKSLTLVKPITGTLTSDMKFNEFLINRQRYKPRDPALNELELFSGAIRIARAGVATDTLSTSAAHKYGQQKVVFLSGPVNELLETSSDLWDHEHVRNLTAADRNYFKSQAAKRSPAAGEHSLALAYRLANDQTVTLLGLVSMTDRRVKALAELKKTETQLTYQVIIRAIQTSLTTSSAQLTLVIISIIGLAAYHLAPAITFMQIAALDLLLCVPVAALIYEQNYRKLAKISWHRPVAFGVLAAVLAYANYLLFFARHNLSPFYIDASLPMYHQAAGLTLLTVLLCGFAYLLFERADHHEQFFTEHLHSNDKLLQAFGASLVLLAAIVYLPGLQTIFSTAPLDIVDWASALVAACVYALAGLLQRHTRKHTRHAVLKLHQQKH